MAHRSSSKRYFALIVIAALVCGLGLSVEPPRVALAASDYSAWNDLGIVYTAPSGRAYYPSVLYDANGFGSGSRLYKMWYSNGSGGVFVITSTNGLNWDTPTAVSGLHAGAHHVQVLYDASCFGTLPCDASAAKYKMWYWAGTMTYAISDLATAQSTDGITWTTDITLAQSATAPLVTGAGVGWNRGSYGMSLVVYRAGAPNSGTEPWNYSYVAYYDGTDGSSEVTGLAYSADGLYWTVYAGTPVLDKGTGNAWDCDDAVYGTVYHDTGGYHFWYSGGGGDNGSGGCLSGAPNNQGIGYASSPDGKTWAKSPFNPIFHISQGVSYRSQRVYTPNIVDDGSGVLKMYYSAVGDDGIYKIGLALNALTLQIVFVDDNWVGLSALTQVTFPGDPDPHFIGVDAFAAIQAGVNAVATGGTVKVAAGTYLEEVNLNKPNLKLLGAGIDQSNVMGHKDIGGASTLTFASNGSLVDGFTITRDGNNPADWAANVKTIGVVFNQGVTSNTLQNSKVTGNRNGLYLNNTQGNTIKYNVITFNRTGFQFANNVSNNVVWQNTITDNWTMGVLFNFDDLTFQTTGITITNNNLSGNWYGDVQCRWANSKALLNLSDNWFGANTVVTSSLNSSEPSYPSQIPVAYGGTATNPGGVANIGGTCSQLVDYTPWLNVGTDISTNPGFQGDFSSLWVSAASPQTGSSGRIQEGVDRVAAGGTVNVVTGTYVENVVITQPLTLAGAGQDNTIVYPALSNPDCRFGGSTVLCTGAPTTTASIMALVQANDVVIHDLTFDGDNPALSSGIVVAGADLDARGGIITNQPAGTFNGLQIDNTTVKNIYLRGIQIYNSTTGFNVHDNRVENVKGDPSQSIAIFNRFGSGVFANNIISGTSDGVVSNWSSGTLYLSNTITNSDSGVHSDNNGGAGGVADLMQGNLVSNCTPGGYGVWVFAPFVGTTVQNNIVSGCDIGLGVFGQNAPATVNFTGNHVTGRAASKGVFVTTDQLGFGSNNVSAVFIDNQIDNSADGFYLESQSGYHLDVVAAQNTISRNATAINLASAGTANAVIKGNTIVTQTAVFSQTGGTLIAYANSIGNFTTGFIDNGSSTTNLKHNWWGTYNDPAPTGLSASDWQARLGAPIQSWIEGSNSATLGNAHLSGGAGTAVIVDHGRGSANAPFGNGITPFVANMCSNFYDFFTVNGSGSWDVSVPADNTPACNSQTLDPGKVFWIPYTKTYNIECAAANPACWDLITTNVITGGQSIVVSSLSVADLGGTPFVVGSSTGTDPTAVNLVSFVAIPSSSDSAIVWILALGGSALTVLVWLFRRRQMRGVAVRARHTLD